MSNYYIIISLLFDILTTTMKIIAIRDLCQNNTNPLLLQCNCACAFLAPEKITVRTTTAYTHGKKTKKGNNNP